MSVQRLRKMQLLCFPPRFLLTGIPGEEPHPLGPVTAFQRLDSERLIFKAARLPVWKTGNCGKSCGVSDSRQEGEQLIRGDPGLGIRIPDVDSSGTAQTY